MEKFNSEKIKEENQNADFEQLKLETGKEIEEFAARKLKEIRDILGESPFYEDFSKEEINKIADGLIKRLVSGDGEGI